MESAGKFKEKLTSLVGEKTANDVRNAIANNKPIIVTGPQGPTGKTTLTNLINGNGGIAFEEFEVLTVRLDRPLSPLFYHGQGSLSRRKHGNTQNH